MPTFDNEHGTVTITQKEYAELVKDSNFLACLQDAGVDNWSGYDYAREAYQESYND
jgi:hypothetical protein